VILIFYKLRYSYSSASDVER